jgi:nucleotide-binding universal stress UspA family protein
MIERILVATDFSLGADEAWRWAVDVARSLDADLRLVHVAMPMSADVPRKAYQDYERTAAQAQRMLQDRAAAAALPSGVKTMLSRGEPVQVLAEMARAENIDLVVVGTHRHHPAGEILVGSVAERLIRLAPCTVAVVKPSKTSVDAAR